MDSTQPDDLPTEALLYVCTLSEYQAMRTSFFPSGPSLRWFMTKHRARLLEEKALLLMRGAWHVHRKRFDDAMVLIAFEEAQKASEKTAIAQPE